MFRGYDWMGQTRSGMFAFTENCLECLFVRLGYSCVFIIQISAEWSSLSLCEWLHSRLASRKRLSGERTHHSIYKKRELFFALNPTERAATKRCLIFSECVCVCAFYFFLLTCEWGFFSFGEGAKVLLCGKTLSSHILKWVWTRTQEWGAG